MGVTRKIKRNEGLFRGSWRYFRHRASGYRIDAAPIFVVGCGHSGTSIMLRLLGQHSRIYGVPYESRVLECPRLKRWLAFKIWNRETVVRQKHRWAEKTPMHVRLIDRAFSTFPDARILFVVRDGRDVAVSMRKRFEDFEPGLLRWIDDNRIGLSWADDPRVMQVRYEDLVQRYEETMPQICAFIEEAFEDDLIAFHEKPAFMFKHRSLSNPGSGAGDNHPYYRNWQINQKLFDGSGKWVKEMTEEEKTCFKSNQDAMQMLINFGYATDDNW